MTEREIKAEIRKHLLLARIKVVEDLMEDIRFDGIYNHDAYFCLLKEYVDNLKVIDDLLLLTQGAPWMPLYGVPPVENANETKP